ncbi:MAG: Ig-like domain-containing protein [Mariprofundaceae bacterium]|nr:Ig-like domain-containing protein [Mariprofundaceae bacterium]
MKTIFFVIACMLLIPMHAISATVNLNFTAIFNKDVVMGTDQTGAFDTWGGLISSSTAIANNRPAANGLPDNGFFAANLDHPAVTLSNFNANGVNAYQVANNTLANVTAQVTPGQYSEVHVYASAGGAGINSPATFKLIMHYTDNTQSTSAIFNVPDWFGNITPNTNSYYLRDRMDRMSLAGIYNAAANPAVFGFKVLTNAAKTLSSISIIVTSNQAGAFNFFGGVATTVATIPVAAIVNPTAAISLNTTTNTTAQMSVSGGTGTFSYATSNSAAATVSPTGLITVAGIGTSVITATDTVTGSASTTTVNIAYAPLSYTSNDPVTGRTSPNVQVTIDALASSSSQLTTSGGSGTYTYTSNSPTLMTVNATGLIQLTAAGRFSQGGSGTITITDAIAAASIQATVVILGIISPPPPPPSFLPLASNSATANLDTGANNTNQFTATGGSGTFTYATSAAPVATVNATGLITAVGAGTATITATDTATGFTTTRVVTVVAAIVNNAATANLGTGVNDTNQMTVTGGSGTFIYTTSAAAVATVSATGLITSVGAGTATITATDTVTGFTTVRVVTAFARVSNAPTTGLDLGVNTVTQMAVNGGSGTFTYTTSNAAVATVSAVGLITSGSLGSAVITATDTVTGVSSTTTVTVTTPLVVTSAPAVNAQGSVSLNATGGSGTSTAAITTFPGVALGTVTASPNGAFVFTAPTTGAFAGDYTITVTDSTTGLTNSVIVSVPMTIVFSNLNIAESDMSQTVTVSGLTNGDVISFNIKDTAGISDTGINAIAADIMNVTASANQAVATIQPVNVTAFKAFTVTVNNTSNVVAVPFISKLMQIVPENSIQITASDTSTNLPTQGVTLLLSNPTAIIRAASQQLTTDAQGIATAILPAGRHLYSAQLAGYSPVTVVVNISAAGATVQKVSLTPIAVGITYTGNISTVAGVDFTVTSPEILAVDANGLIVPGIINVTSATTASFTLIVDSNVFTPVAILAKHGLTHSARVTTIPVTGGNVGAFALPIKNIPLSVAQIQQASLPANAFTTKLVNTTAILTMPIGVNLIQVAVKPLIGAPEVFAPTATLRAATDPVIMLMENAAGQAVSAPVVYPSNVARTVLGTVPVAVGGNVVNIVTNPQVNTTASLQLPVDAFTLGSNPTEVFATFSNLTTVNPNAAFSAQTAIGIDLVLIDFLTRNIVSTDVGNQTLNKVRVSIPVDPDALFAMGYKAANVQTLFDQNLLTVNTAATIQDMDAGLTTLVTGPFMYNPLTGNVSFEVNHFSLFAVGGGNGFAQGGQKKNPIGPVGGCSLNTQSATETFDPLLPAMIVLAMLWLGLRRRMSN